MTSLHTPRLIIRNLYETDLDDYVRMQMMPQMREFRICYPTPVLARYQGWAYARKNLRAEHARDSWLLAITLREDYHMIGDIHLMTSNGIGTVDYGLDPAFRKKGYMAEALNKITDFAHNKIGIERIEQNVLADNIPAWHVMENCGYQRIGEEMVRWQNPEGVKLDSLAYRYISRPVF